MLRKQLREARGNEEKLRSERRSRIKSERQETDARRELDQLKREYLKLESRFQQVLRRQVPNAQDGSVIRISLADFHRPKAGQVLGLESAANAAEVGRIRRRFAALFHPDRVNQLPGWVQSLCEEILGMVNEACDRLECET